MVHDCGEGGMSRVYIAVRLELHLFAGVAPLVSTYKLFYKQSSIFFFKNGLELLISIFRIFFKYTFQGL